MQQPPTTANIHEAKTHLSKLLKQVEQGGEVIIAKSGKPFARIIPYQPATIQRQPGGLEGSIWYADDYDKADAEIAALFNGRD